MYELPADCSEILVNSQGWLIRGAWLAILTAGLVACGPDDFGVSQPSKDQPLLVPSFVIGPITGGDPSTRIAVAKFFAPVFYQNVTHGTADHLTKVSYDNDWNGRNQWENLSDYPTRANVYVSLVEDQNYYFLHYGTYHPRDVCDFFDPAEEACFAGNSEHENDMEGVRLTVDKRLTASEYPYGQVLTMETIFHNGFKIYRNCALPEYVVPRSSSSWPQSWTDVSPEK